jgi:hypothetical protein
MVAMDKNTLTPSAPLPSSMSARNRVVLVNAAILGGLVIEYFSGASTLAIAIAGPVLFLVANAAILFQQKRAGKQENL